MTRIAFVMRQLGYARLFDAPIRALLARGHAVQLLYERPLWTERERSWLDELEQHPSFSSAQTEALRRDRWFVPADRMRRTVDYLHALSPELRGSSGVIRQAEGRMHPAGLRRALRAAARVEPLRRLLFNALVALEHAFPPSPAFRQELRERGIETLVVVPHMAPGGRQSEYVRAARGTGVASVYAVASWDNLTKRQLLREEPDRIVVWNEPQRREAIERHGMHPDRVVVTGVQAFDEWFERRPGDRDAFCRKVGLDPASPYVLWVGGALAPAEIGEADFVAREWWPRVVADGRFDGVGLLVRPHPRRLDEWSDFAPGDERVKMWPSSAAAAMPVDEESRSDFYESIYHGAAVVGINTTAMIEAAVVGRPVLTLIVPEFADSQLGTAHFHYLLTVGGGVLAAARDWSEHLDDLAGTLAGDEQGRAQREQFVREFVRPRGLDVPALPFFVEAVETARPQPAVPEPALAVAAQRIVTAALKRVRRG